MQPPSQQPGATPDIRAQIGELAVELAIGAAAIIRSQTYSAEGEFAPAQLRVTAKSTPTDLVTQVDQGVEAWLVNRIHQLRPDDAILGEEGGEHDAGRLRADPNRVEVRWIIDPIDGTVNFVHGLPRFAVSIAAEIDGTAVAGCVHNPITGDLYRAVLGAGATVERMGAGDAPRRALRGPSDRSLPTAVVATGFSYDVGRRSRQADVVRQLLTEVADIRRLGAASLDLCSVADGEVDAYFEAGLSPWDFAAGELIAREAGCMTSGLYGRPCSTTVTAVCGPASAPGFFGLLERLAADQV